MEAQAPLSSSSGAANYRQVLCSGKWKKKKTTKKYNNPAACYPWMSPISSMPCRWGSVSESPRLKAEEGAAGQSGGEASRAAASKGIAGGWGVETDCRVRTGLLHLVPGLWERWEAAPCLNSTRGFGGQSSRPARVTLTMAASSGGNDNCRTGVTIKTSVWHVNKTAQNFMKGTIENQDCFYLILFSNSSQIYGMSFFPLTDASAEFMGATINFNDLIHIMNCGC